MKMAHENMLLEINRIEVYYEQIAALKGVSLNLERGEILAIIGANGAGKTTLINTISGVLHPRSGSVKFNGDPIHTLPAWRIARKGILQIPEGRKVFAKQSVLENLELGAYSIKDKSAIKASIERMYTLFPVLSERRKQLAGTLSGGEQQMLAIARGLMGHPELLLFDEPSMGLSPVMVERVFKTIQEINRQGITILLVEQNAKKSLQIANRAYVLETGKIVLADTAAKLLENEQVKQAYLGG
jgi:branched-chain amino acid transport system ATP-binding protein